MVNPRTGTLMVPESLQRVLPADVTKVEQYFGSLVRLDCASADCEAFEIRVYLADWIFFVNDTALADSSGIAASNNRHLSALSGEKLMEVVIKGSQELWLKFTSEMSLKLVANLNEYEPDDELLIVSLDVAFLKFSPTKGFVIAPPVRTEH